MSSHSVLIRPVFDHPICDESEGLVDWCATLDGAEKLVGFYRDLGYFEGEFPGTFESRKFKVLPPANEGTSRVAVMDLSDGFLWLWSVHMDLDTLRDFWTKEGAKKALKELPGEVTSAKFISATNKLNEWPTRERFLVLQDGSLVWLDGVIIVGIQGDSNLIG